MIQKNIKKLCSAVILLSCSCPFSFSQTQAELDPAIIESALSPKALMKRVSRYFEKNYAGNIAAKFEYTRAVKDKDGYDQLFCASGIWGISGYKLSAKGKYWDDPHAVGCVETTNAFGTLPRIPGSTDINPIDEVHSPVSYGIKALDIDFSSLPHYEILDTKRTFELFSPLNQSQIKNFELRIVGADLIDGEKVYILEFRDKPGKFPGKTKLHALGRIYAAETGRILTISSDNFEDRYTKSIRYSGGPLPRATETSFVMTYCQINGKLYTDRITKDVRWVKPAGVDENQPIYTEEWNTYRKPFDHELSSHTEISFSEPRFFDADDSERIAKMFPTRVGTYMGAAEFYAPETDMTYVREKVEHLGNKVQAELESVGLSIEEQAIQFNERAKDYVLRTGGKSGLEQIERYRKNYRWVYENIYGNH